jgi:hypothetical protein
MGMDDATVSANLRRSTVLRHSLRAALTGDEDSALRGIGAIRQTICAEHQ